MKYRIVITAFEPNPDYDKQEAEREAQSRYSNQYGDPKPWPAKDIEMHKLDTVLTEAEFNAIRKACLEAM